MTNSFTDISLFFDSIVGSSSSNLIVLSFAILTFISSYNFQIFLQDIFLT